MKAPLTEKRGYTAVEIVLIFFVTSLIIVLSFSYWSQSSYEKVRKRVEEQAKRRAELVLSTLKNDISLCPRGALEIEVTSPTEATINLQVLKDNYLIPVEYSYTRPVLKRRSPHERKEEILTENLVNLGLEESGMAGEVDIGIIIEIADDKLKEPVKVQMRAAVNQLINVPDGVQFVATMDDGMTADFYAAGDFQVTDDEILRFSSMTPEELDSEKKEILAKLSELEKKEEEVNKKLSTLPPGMDFLEFQLKLPGIRDASILREASKQTPLDQRYKETIEEKIKIVEESVSLKRSLDKIKKILEAGKGRKSFKKEENGKSGTAGESGKDSTGGGSTAGEDY